MEEHKQQVTMEPSSSEENSEVNVDTILGELGPVGRYQVYVLFLLCLPNMLGAMYSMNYVFTAGDAPYRCIIEECENSENLHYENVWASQFTPNGTRCYRYAPSERSMLIDNACSIDTYNTSETIPCTSWVYGSHDTIVPEFDLACQDFKRTMVGSIRSTAVLFSLIITGYLSDGWGRKTAFLIFAFFASTLGIVKSFSVNYAMYISVEFFETFLGYGFNSAGYVMIVELARPHLRVIFTSMTGISYGLGGAAFGMIAYALPYWRDLLRVIHTPALLFLLYIVILDESPRWLYGKGRKEEAARIIKKAARWNKVTLSNAAIKELKCKPIKAQLIKEQEIPQIKNKHVLLQVLLSKVLMGRMAVCSFCWIASTFVYYGLSIKSVALSGNQYINYSLSSLMEVIASIFIMMSLERYGRKKCIMIAFLVCGICCIAPPFITDNTTSLIFFFTGKMAITYAFNSIYVYTSELFPTSARNSLLSACSLIGRIGSILAPQTPLLALVLPVLPAFLFGAVALVAACLMLLIPETQNTRLPETIYEAEHIDSLRTASNVHSAFSTRL